MNPTNVGSGMVPHKKSCRCDECEVERLQAKLSAVERERDLAVRDLCSALARMDRARSILTKDNPTPDNNWGMLDTSDLRSRKPR